MSDPNQTRLKQEAIAKLETEAEQRIDLIRQSVDFHLAALRAQGNMEINKMLLSVRKMTMEEYCHVYGANPQLILDAQTRKRKRTDFRSLKRASFQKTTEKHVNEKEEPTNVTKPTEMVTKDNHAKDLTTKRVQVGSEKELTVNNNKDAEMRNTAEDEEENDFGPLFVHLTRDKHPRVSFRLDAQRDTSQLGHFELSAPNEILDDLGLSQRRRVRDQIDDILGQLETLKRRLQ